MEKRHPNHPGELSVDRAEAERLRSAVELEARARAIQVLKEAEIPFLVGGAYAYCNYTGIYRDTKDLDLFLKKEDALRALEILAGDGWRTERADEVWLYKGFKGEYFVDLIFSSGNGVATVDDAWFDHAEVGEAFGHKVLLIPAEEMIWSKGFVLERERYDGADVAHVIRARGDRMDWPRLLQRFNRHWEVLLAHVTLFRFAYPSDRSQVPDWLLVELLNRSVQTLREGNWEEKICRGPLISRVNYVIDVGEWGYQNGRVWDERERERGVASERSDLEGARSGGR